MPDPVPPVQTSAGAFFIEEGQVEFRLSLKSATTNYTLHCHLDPANPAVQLLTQALVALGQKSAQEVIDLMPKPVPPK